jgi:hypothetical protein
MIDLKEKAHEVEQRGYCVLESAYSESECADIRAIFKRLCDSRGGFSAESPKFSFHPLLECEPQLAPFYAKSIVIDAMAEIFGDAVRLAHSGAAIHNNDFTTPMLTHWHNHYSWSIPASGLQRHKAERLLCNIYVDGTGSAIGPLIVQPRGLNDAIEPLGDAQEEWQGQVEVHAPPGAAVIFDTALWHSSKRGQSGGIRHLWGGHYQGWNNDTPHPEDNSADSPTLIAHLKALTVLRGLLEAV